ncbi:MAG: hypothetical protein ABIO38_08805, partial [Luteimonas sp.]
MSEPGNREVRKSRAPYILVAAVGIVIVAAVTISSYRRAAVQPPAPSATPADRAMSDIGTPPPGNRIASVADQAAAMTASRAGRRDERKQKLRDARLAAADRFEQESVDPVWSAGKESRLQTLADE